MKKILWFLIFIVVAIIPVLLFPSPILAAKKRVTSSPVVGNTASFSSVAIFPSRLGIVNNFFNLNKASKVSYVLSYYGSGQSQGVVGSFTPSKDKDSRELLFGTCSHGACRYHEGVATARLTLNFTLKSGGVVTKRYLIKVKK